MRLVLTAFLFIFGFIANASPCDAGDTAVRFGTTETGVGIAAGVAVGLHGCDQAAAGWMKMVSGSDYDTLTSCGMQGLGVPRDAANIVDAGMSIVGSAGIGIAARAGTVAGAEGSAINRVTTDFIGNAEVTSFGKVVGRGTVDVRTTVKAINDGIIKERTFYRNRDGLLPIKTNTKYYKEYELPTPFIPSPGSQRIIRGFNGELYYTPDHYKSFIPLN